MRWVGLRFILLMPPGVATAQPSLIPRVDAIQPQAGKPYLTYRGLVAAPPVGLAA